MPRLPAFFIWMLVLVLMMPQESIGQLKMMETDDMRMISYDFGHNYILPHAAKCFHNTLRFHEQLFDYQATEKVTVLVQDFGDYGNAGATAIPFNFITMGLSPFSYTFETSPSSERVFSMMNHELVHVVALDDAARSDRFWQKVFIGKVNPTKDHPLSMIYSYMTSPRMYSPRWYHEGIAAYMETWMNGGIGLAMGSFDEMVFRTLVHENAHIYSAQGLESEGVTTDFQGRSNSYLYGTRFMGYLAYTYSPEQVIEWVKRTNDSKAFFAGEFKRIFGISIAAGWDNWLAWEKDWQQENINALSANPITHSTLISHEKLGSVSFAHYDEKRQKIYVAVNYPGHYPHLAAIDLNSGNVENLADIKGPALFYVSSVAYDEEGDALFYTTDNNAWRDLMLYDLATGKTQMLQRNARTGDLAFNATDQSIWGIKHLNGLSTIVEIPKDAPGQQAYASWQQIYTLPYGHDIFDIDISPDGKLLSAAVSDLAGHQSLLLYDLEALKEGEVLIDTIFNFEVSSPQSFRFTKDGKYLIGASYYSGVSNIFRVTMATQEIHAMSNAITGYFRPVMIDEERLFAFEYSSEGFRPVIIPNHVVDRVSSIDFLGNRAVAKDPILKDWTLSMTDATQMDLATVNAVEKEYRPGKWMSVNYAYPTIVGYKDRVGLGYKMNITDPINFREINLHVAYTPLSWTNRISPFPDSSSVNLDTDERYHFSLSSRFNRFTFSAAFNEASFYDLFGPRIASRKGFAAGIDYDQSIIWDPPITLDLNFGLEGHYGLDRSPDFQQITTTAFDQSLFLNLYGSLTYTYFKKSLGAVEEEKGFRTRALLSVAQSEGNYYPNLTVSADYGFQLPMRHSSIWLRGAAGNSFETEFTPFTRFAFASFGNNYVDHQDYKRYRTPYSFPGVSFTDGPSIIAKEYFKGQMEWVLPPLRFRKFGGFNFFANWMQTSLFSSFLAVNDPQGGHREWANIGGQMDLRMVVFSHLPSTLSFGYARAWDLNQTRSYGEWMISLKILK